MSIIVISSTPPSKTGTASVVGGSTGPEPKIVFSGFSAEENIAILKALVAQLESD